MATLPFLAWVGGKRKIAAEIIQNFPQHHCYCEVFGGGGAVFFAKSPAKVEVINDINRELITLYRVIRCHLTELLRHLRWVLSSRDDFEALRAIKPEHLTDVQRAARFFLLTQTSFGAKLISPSYGYSSRSRPRLNVQAARRLFLAAHKRLSRVYIECLPYQDVIARYDDLDTLFYLDPPYPGTEHYYGKGLFCRDDFVRLTEILPKIKGKFVLSIGDTPEIRELFARFCIREIGTTYTLHKATNKHATELLITNYERGGARAKELNDECSVIIHAPSYDRQRIDSLIERIHLVSCGFD